MLTSRLLNIRSVLTLFNLPFSTAKADIPRRLQNRQKKRPALLTPEDKKMFYNPVQALHLMRLHSFTTFQELNVNPKNGEQMVRGTANLPAGLGKTIKTAVLCSAEEWEELQNLKIKVDYHLTDAKIKNLDKEPIQFEKLFTTPWHLPKIKHLGKVLGPKGLMPNAKLGTLVSYQDLPLALEQAKAGQVSYRVDNGKSIHAQIGKISFTDQQLLRNWQAVMKSLVQKRPVSTKGKYFTEAWVTSTMGPSWKINLDDIDPRTKKNIWGIFKTEEDQE